MNKKKFRWDFWNVVTVGIIILFIVCMIYPLLNLFLSGFQETTRVDGADVSVWTFANYAKFFSRKYYTEALLNSFKLTICVTAVAVLLGVPLAYFMSFYKI